MPAIDSWAVVTPDVTGNVLGGSTGDFPDQPEAGDDFDTVMQATLAPPPQKPADTSHVRPENHRVPGQALAGTVFIAGGSVEKSGPVSAGAKVDDKKKRANETDHKISPDTSNPAFAMEMPEPLPVFLSSPLPFSALMPAPDDAPRQAGKTGGRDKTSAIAGATSGPVASSVLALPDKAKAATAIPATEVPAARPVATPPPAARVETSAAKSEKTAKDNDPANIAKLEGLKILKPVTETTAGDPAPEPKQATAPPTDKDLDGTTGHTLEQAAANAGMGVASMVLQMKNQQKTNKVAGADVKVLPVGENRAARENNLPPQLLVASARGADNRGTDLNFAFSNGNNHDAVAENAPVLNAVDLPSLMDARMRALDRTQDMMALHAMRLVESKSDVLTVVIKPAVGTELSLELHQHAEGVEARATLTLGDHKFLSQHWPELQQRLELRGIKLAPLGDEMNFSTSDNGQFQRQQAAQEEAAQRASAFAEFATAGANGGATARLAVIHEGWESWA